MSKASVLEVLEQGGVRGPCKMQCPDQVGEVDAAARVAFDRPQKRGDDEQGRLAACMALRKGKSPRGKGRGERGDDGSAYEDWDLTRWPVCNVITF